MYVEHDTPRFRKRGGCMQSFKDQLVRFLLFLKGEGVQSGPDQLKRLITILGLATALGLLISPLALLITLPHSNTDPVLGNSATATATAISTRPSDPTATSGPPTQPGAPIKGLTDNPAYQWW